MKELIRKNWISFSFLCLFPAMTIVFVTSLFRIHLMDEALYFNFWVKYFVFAMIMTAMVVECWFYRSSKTMNPIPKLSCFTGINIGLLIFVDVFSFEFFIASMPAVTEVSLCWVFRPWWRLSNIVFALVPALVAGGLFYHAAKSTLESSSRSATGKGEEDLPKRTEGGHALPSELKTVDSIDSGRENGV